MSGILTSSGVAHYRLLILVSGLVLETPLEEIPVPDVDLPVVQLNLRGEAIRYEI